MASIPLQHSNHQDAWTQPRRGTVAMVGLIIAESSIFTIFVVAYLYYLGRDVQGPTPKEVLDVPIFYTVCLLSSSFFIWLAERAIGHGKMAAFRLWWSITILLGITFLGGTATEWHKLIVRDQLTISTNLFGTTYYSLVGLACFACRDRPYHDAPHTCARVRRRGRPAACISRQDPGSLLAFR